MLASELDEAAAPVLEQCVSGNVSLQVCCYYPLELVPFGVLSDFHVSSHMNSQRAESCPRSAHRTLDLHSEPLQMSLSSRCPQPTIRSCQQGRRLTTNSRLCPRIS